MDSRWVYAQLACMGKRADSVEIIREKDGVIVARVRDGVQSCVFKGFVHENFRREIAHYCTLAALGMPTLQVLAHTDASLLLEDVETSERWRLGAESDMDSPAVAIALAAWYKRLHAVGYDYVARHGKGLYDENDVITRENLVAIQQRTHTEGLRVWSVIDQNMDALLSCIHGARRTLTYNDFYYTNLVVAHDGGEAMMFDYNLLGKGYAYADVRNVCSSLSARAGEAFLQAYGGIDTQEKRIDQVASVLTTLHFACRRAEMPDWARESLACLHGDLTQRVERLLGN